MRSAAQTRYIARHDPAAAQGHHRNDPAPSVPRPPGSRSASTTRLRTRSSPEHLATTYFGARIHCNPLDLIQRMTAPGVWEPMFRGSSSRTRTGRRVRRYRRQHRLRHAARLVSRRLCAPGRRDRGVAAHLRALMKRNPRPTPFRPTYVRSTPRFPTCSTRWIPTRSMRPCRDHAGLTRRHSHRLGRSLAVHERRY